LKLPIVKITKAQFLQDRRLRTDGFFVGAGFLKTCALRAPTVFLVRMKSASVQETRLWLTPNAARRFYTRSSIAHGCAFHPCAIDDPRGRLLVRATSQLRSNGGAT
jgi:hypothetical protein